MQRLTKYSLLLIAIRKHVHEDSTAEIMDGMVSSGNGIENTLGWYSGLGC